MAVPPSSIGSPQVEAGFAAGSRTQTTFASLPLELVDHIVGLAVEGEQLPIRLERHLNQYALVHSCFLAAAQRRLFSHPVVESTGQAVTLTRLVTSKQRLAGYVRSLRVIGEHMSEPGLLDELREVGRVCGRLHTLHLSDVAFHTAKHTNLLARLTRLDLANATLSLEAASSTFPALLTLNLNNAAILHTSASPSFPALQRLHYSNTLPTLFTFFSSPIFFSSVSVLSTGAHLKHLTVARLYSPLHYLTARKSPALIAGPLPPAPPTALTLAAETEPSLASFHITSLALLADSSHQAGAYFPLLDSLPLPPRKQLSSFEVMVDLGLRDKAQEVEGVAEELMRRFFPNEEQAEEDSWKRESALGPLAPGVAVPVARSRTGLKELLLPKVFQQFGWLQAVQELRETAKSAGVRIAFVC